MMIAKYPECPDNGWYNGFSLPERFALDQTVRWFTRHEIERPTQCQVCAQSSGIIFSHAEDYNVLTGFFALCPPCHTTLHGRFKRPRVFEEWITRLESGWQPLPEPGNNWPKYRANYVVHHGPLSPVPGTYGNDPAQCDLRLFKLARMEYTPFVPGELYPLIEENVSRYPDVSTLSMPIRRSTL